MYHYTYKLTHIETKEYYFGSRSCKVHPLLDEYMGSMITWKPDKSKLKKELIRFDFNERYECISHERDLIIEHKNDPLNKNANIPGLGFHTVNLGVFIDENGKAYRAHKDDILVKNGTLRPFWEGRTHSEESKSKMSGSARNRNMSEEAKAVRNQKMSESASGVKKSEEHKKNIALAKVGANNPMYGKKAKQVTCPHCNKTLGVNMASRYHFENCKILKEC